MAIGSNDGFVCGSLRSRNVGRPEQERTIRIPHQSGTISAAFLTCRSPTTRVARLQTLP
jgi:hypothetical protein